ncbi:MAG: DnaJ domain-containing protein [Proteobacteria bacterium]|nr:DnaJ domain-containing protein [Pseudomonadota bacterium]
MAKLTLLALALVGIFFGARWLLRRGLGASRFLRVVAIATAVGLLLYLALSGRLHWLFAAAGSLLLFARRLIGLAGLLPLLQQLRGRSAGAAPGRGAGSDSRASSVRTRFVRMSLDHDSGVMTGEVLEGPLKGRRIETLSYEDLLQLLYSCRQQDPDSALLVESYLDRVHGARWRKDDAAQGERDAANGSARSGKMTRAEACEVLGVSEDATEEQISAAHRELLRKVHPDVGGSTYLASKINQARDLLLGR